MLVKRLRGVRQRVSTTSMIELDGAAIPLAGRRLQDEVSHHIGVMQQIPW